LASIVRGTFIREHARERAKLSHANVDAGETIWAKKYLKGRGKAFSDLPGEESVISKGFNRERGFVS